MEYRSVGCGSQQRELLPNRTAFPFHPHAPKVRHAEPLRDKNTFFSAECRLRIGQKNYLCRK